VIRHRWSHGEQRRPFFDSPFGAFLLGCLFAASALFALWTYMEAR
jgi:hypothetical protein